MLGLLPGVKYRLLGHEARVVRTNLWLLHHRTLWPRELGLARLRTWNDLGPVNRTLLRMMQVAGIVGNAKTWQTCLSNHRRKQNGCKNLGRK